MQTTEDRYNGITVDPATLPPTKEEFEQELQELMAASADKNLLWVHIPIAQSDYIPVLTKLGFVFHHCNETYLMLVKQLVEGALIPTSRTHLVGVGAIVRDGNQLLVIKDRYFEGYKLPGGHIDRHESIKEALKREVYEETGVHIEFESILNLGHFTQGQFDASALYIVCTAKALSKEINIYDASEILDARWMDVDEFLSLEDTNHYNKSVVKASLNNTDLKLTEHQIPLRVAGEVFY